MQIVWNCIGICLIFVVVWICVSILNYAKWRRAASKNLPAIKVRFFNLLGNVSELPLTKKSRNGLSMGVYFQQLVLGHAKLLEKENLYCLWMLFHPLIILLKAEAVEAIYNGKKNLDKGVLYKWIRVFFGNSVLTCSTEKWKTQRKLQNPWFRPGIIKEHLQTINEHSQKLVERLERKTEKDSINITEYLADCTFDITCGFLFGVNVGAQESKKEAVECLDCIVKGIRLLEKRFLNAFMWTDFVFYRTKAGRELKKHCMVIKDFTTNLILKEKQELLKHSQTDKKKDSFIVQLLLKKHFESKEMRIEDIRDELITFMVAGEDTTHISLSWILYLLGLDIAVQSKVHQELDMIFGDDLERHATMEDLNSMKYLDGVIKEALRLYPPAPLIGRRLDEDTTICGYQIPKGTTCLVLLPVLHRDEKVFPNTEKFNPERFLPENSASRHPCAWMPFSAGPRNCIGKHLAFIELQIIASTVLRRYTIKSLDHRDKVLPTLSPTVDSSVPIRIKIRPRHLKKT